jgi:predicted nucleotidyltransferase component of viral defense system
MPDSFLDVPRKDQAELLRLHAETLGMQPFLLEKDIWLCWALEQLFNMPDRMLMAFKGGTSLSKAYKAVDRFSEDIDITLDYRGFVQNVRDTGTTYTSCQRTRAIFSQQRHMIY